MIDQLLKEGGFHGTNPVESLVAAATGAPGVAKPDPQPSPKV